MQGSWFRISGALGISRKEGVSPSLQRPVRTPGSQRGVKSDVPVRLVTGAQDSFRMNWPSDLQSIEQEFARVRGMLEQDRAAVVSSDRPEVQRVFLRTTEKLYADLESRLRVVRAGSSPAPCRQ